MSSIMRGDDATNRSGSVDGGGGDGGDGGGGQDRTPLLAPLSIDTGKDAESGMGSAMVEVTDAAAAADAAVKKEKWSRSALWLSIWIANNLAVTLLNKATMSGASAFRYPYTLSSVHMACNTIGAQLYFYFSKTQKPMQLEPSSRSSIYVFSIFFSLNIAIGNVSLQHVSVNLNQVFRALVPVLVMIFGIVWQRKQFSAQRKMAVVPIVIGVALACYGEMSYTTQGLIYTILCVFLAALKLVMSGELLTGDLKLHPVDLLSKMCPLALLEILFLAVMTGEVWEILGRWEELSAGGTFPAVLLSGITSFSLNICSFMANKVTSPLTLCITANVKQVLLILVSTLYFGTPVSMSNALGIVIVLFGGAIYSYVSVSELSDEKKTPLRRKPQANA